MGRQKKLIIGNWKMNFTVGEASLHLHRLAQALKPDPAVEVILAPSTISLQSLSLQIKPKQFKLAAQNFYWRDFGAFSGETSIHQLKGIVQYALAGYSERRYIFGETNKDVRKKVAAALRHAITPVLCIGETAHERQFNETSDVIYDQLVSGLAEVTSEDVHKVVIAYEPVWAISTTKDADICTPETAAKAIRLIRRHVEHLYGHQAAADMRVVYGGGINEHNAASYLLTPGVDGLLVGSSSLRVKSFIDIVEKAKLTGEKG
jgi:triosephosphate isomerase